MTTWVVRLLFLFGMALIALLIALAGPRQTVVVDPLEDAAADLINKWEATR